MNPNKPLAPNCVIPAEAEIQLIKKYPAKAGQNCCLAVPRNSPKAARFVRFTECLFMPDNPLGHEPTVGASLLAKNFASKLAPTIGKTSNGQSSFMLDSGLAVTPEGGNPGRNDKLMDYPG